MLEYEQKKTDPVENQKLLDQLKMAKLEKAAAEAKVSRVKELEAKITAGE